MSDQTDNVVIYAAKSTTDEHGSIPTQIEHCRAAAEQHRWTVADEFSDEAFSAFSGNRGPGLEKAKALAVKIASERGRCILLAQDADRFARGAGDAPGAADHLGEIFFVMKRQGVELWTVRTGHLDGIRAFLEGERSHGESARKTQAVKAGKRRQAIRGEHLGGPAPLGYVRTFDGKRRLLTPDPETAPLIRRVFDLAEQGVPDAQLGRAITSEGYRTRGGNPFDRRAIQSIIQNATYAALVSYEGDEYEGTWQPLVDREVWRGIQRNRAKRDLGAGKHVKGRPAHGHLLARLVRCGKCGSPMFAVTSTYRRKDGTRQRQYVCRGYKTGDGTCDFRVDAAAVDTAILENLPTIMPRFNDWIAQIEDRHASERQRLAAECDKAQAERDEAAEQLTRAQGTWLRLDAAKQEALLETIQLAKENLAAAEVRAQATDDALATVPENVAYDRLLDFASSLRDVIAGRLAGDRSTREVNVALVELFDGFTIWPGRPELSCEDAEAEEQWSQIPGGPYVVPAIRMEVVLRLMRERWDECPGDGSTPPLPEPPIEWIEAITKSANAHAYRWTNPNLRAFVASQP